MDKNRWFDRLRTGVNLCFTALTNGYAAGFAKGKIYQGRLKRFCLPGLNCYSCPGALGACPIGALQAVLTDRGHWCSFYMVGFFLFVGAVLGRFVCGWLCPFGLVQELVHKIPFPRKKVRRLPGDRYLRKVKYAVLILLVILLPLLVTDGSGQGQPWFCQYLCPSGTLLGGIPLLAANPVLRGALGWLFSWKFTVLAALLLFSAVVYRPFCRYLCPLGAIYGLFNPIAFCRLRFDKARCTHCGCCARACKMDIVPCETPNSAECIRCGDCVGACPHGALSMPFRSPSARPVSKEVK